MSDAKPDTKAKKEKYFGSVKFFKNMITIFIILLIAGLIAVVVYLWYNQNSVPIGDGNQLVILEGPPDGDGRGILVTPENVDSFLNEVPTDTHVTVSLSFEWDFDTWDSPTANGFVANDEENSRVFYVDIHLLDPAAEEELGELIYSSPYIPIGARLANFALDKELAAGNYEVIIVHKLVDDEFNFITDTRVVSNFRIHN